MSAPNALFTETLMLLGGAVVTAPIFKKLGLGTVLGYLAAGVVIGPVLHGIGDGESVAKRAHAFAIYSRYQTARVAIAWRVEQIA